MSYIYINIKKEASRIIHCSCGLSFRNDYIKIHRKTNKHFKRMSKINEMGFESLYKDFSVFNEASITPDRINPFDSMTCVCGSIFRRDYKINHFRSNKHKQFLKDSVVVVIDSLGFEEAQIKCCCGVSFKEESIKSHLKTNIHIELSKKVF